MHFFKKLFQRIKSHFKASINCSKTIVQLQLYDSRTCKLISLSSCNPVKIYLCGPTVYDDLHIGNIRNILLLDALTHFLRINQYQVEYVQNITDVADKIPLKASTLQISEKALTEKFFQNYQDLLKKLEVKTPFFIKISEIMPATIKVIKKLNSIQAIYTKSDGVYFEVNKFAKNYGVFKKWLPKNLISQRKLTSNQKENPEDFALWKKTIPGKKWESPWGAGRPGWHTECVAAITQHFLDGVTIHIGGSDLKFPHHENERIQFYALYKKEIAQIWMHNGFVNFENQKISKSQKNLRKSFLAKDFLQDYSANTIKIWFFLSTYQNDIDFSETYLDYCRRLEEKIITTFKKVDLESFINLSNVKTGIINAKDYQKFIKILSKNFDTVNALDFIVLQIKKINQLLQLKNWNEARNQKQTVITELKLLRIQISNSKINKSTQKIIQKWQGLLKNKNYVKADILRKELQKLFIL